MKNTKFKNKHKQFRSKNKKNKTNRCASKGWLICSSIVLSMLLVS